MEFSEPVKMLLRIDWWTWIERTSALASLVGIPYLVTKERKRAPRFSFSFRGSSGKTIIKDGHEFRRFEFIGDVINHSVSENTIHQVCLVVWRDKKRNDTRRFGYGAISITDESGQKLAEPLKFEPLEGKRLTIVFETIIKGSTDEPLLNAFVPLQPGSEMYLPKYTYQLAFEDVNGNLFDQDGKLRNRKGIDLRWTLPNTFDSLRDGNPLPLVKHRLAILWSDVRFAMRRFLNQLGL